MSGKRFVILTASEQLPAKLAVASLPEVQRLGEQFTNQLTLSVNVFPLRGKAWPPWLPFQASFGHESPKRSETWGSLKAAPSVARSDCVMAEAT